MRWHKLPEKPTRDDYCVAIRKGKLRSIDFSCGSFFSFFFDIINDRWDIEEIDDEEIDAWCSFKEISAQLDALECRENLNMEGCNNE